VQVDVRAGGEGGQCRTRRRGDELVRADIVGFEPDLAQPQIDQRFAPGV
jgi:hypothetical protein